MFAGLISWLKSIANWRPFRAPPVIRVGTRVYVDSTDGHFINRGAVVAVDDVNHRYKVQLDFSSAPPDWYYFSQVGPLE